MAHPDNPFAALVGPPAPNPFAALDVAQPTNPFDVFMPSPEEEEKPEDLPWYQDLPRRAAASGLGLARSLSRVSEAGRRAMTPDFLEGEEANRYQDEVLRDIGMLADYVAPPDRRPFLDRLGDPDVSKLKTVLGAGAEAVPSLIPMAAGFAIAGPPGAAAAAGAVGFTTSGLDAYDASIAEGNDEASSLALAGVVGSLSALLEGFGARGLSGVVKSAFGRDLAKRVARGETDMLIRQTLKGAAVEGGTEMAQVIVEAGGELIAGKPLAEVLDTLDDRLAQAGTGGFLLGGGVGTVSLAGKSARDRGARRSALRDALEQARVAPPEALAEFIRPRQPGEWAMQALPTGEWTSESLAEAHQAYDDVVLPDVLAEEKKGIRRLKVKVRGAASMFGAEGPVVELVRGMLPTRFADQFQDLLSYGRKSTTVGRTIKDAAVVNHENVEIAPAYKDIIALTNTIQEHPVADPSQGRWLAQYYGRQKVKDGPRSLPSHIKKSPGQRYLEERRAVNAQLALRDKKGKLADRLDELNLQIEAVSNPVLAQLLTMPEIGQAHPPSPTPVTYEPTPPPPPPTPDPFTDPGGPSPPPAATEGTVAPQTPGARARAERRQAQGLRDRVDRAAAELGVPPEEIRSLVEQGGLPDLEAAIAQAAPVETDVDAVPPAPTALDLAIQQDPQPAGQGSVAEPPIPVAASARRVDQVSGTEASPTVPQPGLDALTTERDLVQEEHDAINFSKQIMQDVEERDAWLREHPQHGILERAADAASTWDQHLITMLADAEIISRAQEERILAAGKHYAGFFLTEPKAMPPNVRERLAKAPQEPGRLKTGLRRDVPHMLPSEGSLYRASVVQAEALQQLGKNELLKLVEAAPSYWAEAGVGLAFDDTVHTKGIRVRAMREGKEVPVYMPLEMVKAFEQLTSPERNLFVKGAMGYLEGVANQRRVTALQTATFAIGQVWKDQPNAALWAAEVGYRPYVEMARGMLHQMTGSADYQAFRAFGGGMQSIASADIETSQDLLSEVALRAEEADITSTAKLAATKLLRFGRTWRNEVLKADPKHMFSGLFYPTARLIETLDTSTRMGAYLRALDKGYSEAEALAVSRRSAIDFGLAGDFAGSASKIYPFFNAKAQGVSLDRQAIKRAGRAEKDAGKGAAGRGWAISKAVALKAGAAALLPLFYMMVLPELIHWVARADDEEFHNEREPWEKKKKYFWAKRDDGEWLTTPRPQGILAAIFGYALGQALDEAYRDNPDTLKNVLRVLQDEIPGVAEATLQSLPPGLEPAQQVMTGRTTWQKRLVVTNYQEMHVPPRQQGYRSTPSLYRDWAKVIPGNAEEMAWAAAHKAEAFSRVANVTTAGRVGSEKRFSTTAKVSKYISPLWLEQAGRFATGSVGSEVVRSVEAVQSGLAGEDVPLSKIPGVRNFFARAKDAPQMWPPRRVLELAEEGKAYLDLERQGGEGMSKASRRSLAALQRRVREKETMSQEQEARLLKLEDQHARARRPGPGDVDMMATYARLAERASEIRDLMSDWHNLNEAGEYEAMERVDDLIIKLSIEALTEHGDYRVDPGGLALGTGKSEIGSPGKGWAAQWFKRVGAR